MPCFFDLSYTHFPMFTKKRVQFPILSFTNNLKDMYMYFLSPPAPPHAKLPLHFLLSPSYPKLLPILQAPQSTIAKIPKLAYCLPSSNKNVVASTDVRDQALVSRYNKTTS